MFTSQIIRRAGPAIRVNAVRSNLKRRSYTTGSDSNPATSPGKGSSKTGPVLATLAVAAGAGYYWYSTYPDEAEKLQKEAKRQEAEIKAKGHELQDAGKARANAIYKQGEKAVEDTKKVAESKYEDYKAQAQKAEHDARASAQEKYDNARTKVEQKGEEVKQGWFSWLGWGKSKAEDAKKEGADKVSDAAQAVQKEANKRT